MKSIKTSLLAVIVIVSLSACTKEAAQDTSSEMITKAVQAGEAQAVVKIIQRAQKNPCQPIYLFNHLDENNKQEVNLINIACESLGLPAPEKAIEGETTEETSS